MNILIQVAIRNVFRNRRRSLFTLTAIVIGLAVVLLITSVSNAFYRFSIENAVNVKLGALQIHRTGYLSNISANPIDLNFEYTPELIERISRVQGVKAASGRIVFRGLVSNGRNQALFFGNAVDVERERQVCPRWLGTLTEGSKPLEPSDSGSAMVGQELARSLNVVPQGFKVSEQTQSAEVPPSTFLNISGVSPQGRQNAVDVQVVATTRSLLPVEEKRSLVLPLGVAQSLLGLEGRVTEIAVAVEKLDDLGRVQERLQKVLGADYEVSTWSDVQPFLRDVLFRQRVLIGIVSVILFVLVLFVIANTMTMAVFERTREIGTMLSLGIKRQQIQSIFFAESVFVGIAGATGGSLLGLLLVLVLNSIGVPFPTEGNPDGRLFPFVELGFVVFAFFVALACAAIAGIFPAQRASRMNPVEALRAS